MKEKGTAKIHIGKQGCYPDQTDGAFSRWFPWWGDALHGLPETWSACAKSAFEFYDSDARYRMYISLQGRDITVSLERMTAEDGEAYCTPLAATEEPSACACLLTRGNHKEIFYRPMGKESALSCTDLLQIAESRGYWCNSGLHADCWNQFGQQYFGLIFPFQSSICLWYLPIVPEKLSAREARAISLAKQGLSYRTIAAVMHLSENCVKKTILNGKHKDSDHSERNIHKR